MFIKTLIKNFLYKYDIFYSLFEVLLDELPISSSLTYFMFFARFFVHITLFFIRLDQILVFFCIIITYNSVKSDLSLFFKKNRVGKFVVNVLGIFALVAFPTPFYPL